MASPALTRVRNNQVYNSDIYASAKLVPYSITGGLLGNNFTYTGNMTIGNLTVNGNTTTIDTTNLVVADPLLAINRNQSGTPTYDLGFVMGRGNQTNVAMIWEETNKQFQLQYTTESTSSTTFGTINNSGFANLQAYGILVNNASITTANITTANITNASFSNVRITGGYIDGTAIGANVANTAVFTSVTLSNGGQFIGYFTGPIGANTANTGAFTTLSTTGNITAGGNINITGNIIPSVSNIYSLGSSTNRFANLWIKGTTIYIGSIAVQDGGGYLSVADPNTGQQLGIQVASINNTVIGNTGPAAATFTTANVNSTLYATTVNASTIGNTGATFSGASSTLTGASQAASFTTSGGGQLSGYLTGAIGANTANSGTFTTANVNGTLYAATVNAGTIGNSGAAFTGASIVTTTSSQSASFTTTGGGQFSGYFTGAIGANTANSGTFTTVVSSGNITAQTANVYAAYIVGNTAIYGTQYYWPNGATVAATITGTYSNSNVGGYLTSYNGTLTAGSITTTSGGQISGYLTGALGANTPNTVVATSVTTSNGGQLIGYFTGAIGANSANSGVFTTVAASGNITAQTANVYAANIIGNTAIYGAQYYWSNGAAIAATITGTYSNSNVASYLLAYTGNISAGNLTLTNGGQVFGYFTGALGANTPNTVVATSVTTSSGGQHIGYFTGAIGANTPNTGVFTTASTSGNLVVGGNLNLTGNVVNITANVYSQGGIFYGAATTGFNALYVGQTGYTPLAQTLVQVSGNYNGFVQVNEQNTNSGASASTDFIATANNGNDVDTYIDFGINSSGYQNSTYGLQSANDGYLYVAGNTTTGGGNLVISTTTANDIIYSLGGIATANEFARMRANTNSFVISSTTATTNTTSGALQVRGGAGVSGNIYSGANINATNFVASTATYSPIYYYSNGVNILSALQSSAYTNANAAAYLTVYTGNLLAGNITALNNITGYLNGVIGANAANSATFTTASITNTANSYGSGQGALQIAGGFYAGGDSYINGNLQIVGNITSVGYNELIANAPLLYLSGGSISTYNYELGFYSHKYDAVEGYNHTGFVRNHVDNAWYVFSNIRTEPGATVDLANANIVYDTVKLGNIIAYSGNTSTSTTTGAAVIYGGMGVGGNIYAAAIQNTPIGNGTASTGAFTTLTASGTITGAGQVVGYFNGVIGANTANSGTFTAVVASGNITAQTANVYAANIIGNTALYGAQFYWSNGAALANTITGLYSNSNVAAYLPTYTGTLSPSSLTTNNGGQVSGYITGAIGANTPNTGAFTSLTTSSTIVSQGTITGAGQVVGYFNGVIGANTANTGNFTSITTTGSGGNITGTNTGYVVAGYIVGNNNVYGGSYLWYNNNNTLASTITGTYSNSNVAVYLPTYTGNLTAGNVTTVSGGQMSGYLTGALGANTPNTVVATSVTTVSGGQMSGYLTGAIGANTANSGVFTTISASANISAYSNLNVVGNIGVGNFVANTATYSPQYYWSNGAALANTITGLYSNSNVAAYLPTYTGNIQAGNITTVNSITGYLNGVIGANAANSGSFTTILASGNITAQTANLYASYVVSNSGLSGTLITNAQTNITSVGTLTSLTTSGNITAQTANVYAANIIGNTALYGAQHYWTNGATLASTITGTYGNSNVAAYLPTYTGNISAGNVNLSGALTSPNIFANSGASSTSTTTGALIVQGGVGISGNIYLGSNVFAGSPSYSDVNIKYSGSMNINNYVQSILQNTNNGTTASADFIVNNDQSTATTYYGDFGMNSSGFSGTGSLSAPNNVYLTSTSSDLVLGTTTSNAIRFVINSGATDAAIIATNGNVVIQTTTTSTSSTTGALVVNGGHGVVGNIYSGANITAATAVIAPTMYNSNIYPISGSDLYKNTGPNGNLWINYNGYAANVIVNGNTTAGYGNLFIVNGSTGQVGIKQGFNAFVSGASLQFGSTDSVLLPSGTTSQRPTGVGGMIRYNSTTNSVEFYNAGTSTWQATGSTFTTVSSNQFTGDGATVAFTLSQSATTNSTIVAINGVVQIPTTAYSVSGSTLTFTEAPLSTDIIDARVITTTSVVTALSQGNSAVQVSDTTGTNANVSVVTNNTYRYIANVGTTGSNYFSGGQAPMMSNIALTQNTPTTIDSFSTSAYRVAKYVIKITDGTTNNYCGAEIIVAHNGTTATSQVYGVVNTGSNSLATFSSTVSGGTVSVTANTWSSTASATVFPIYMPI